MLKPDKPGAGNKGPKAPNTSPTSTPQHFNTSTLQHFNTSTLQHFTPGKLKSVIARYQRFWPVLFFALVAVLPLWRAVFLGEAIGPHDQIRAMAPWNEAPPNRPWDVLQADSVLQFHVWRDLVFRAHAGGEAPLWNPYELCGTPLAGNSQSAAFYPPHIAIGYLHIPTPVGITLLAWFHLFWAGLGTYYLGRRLRSNKIGACIGGVLFALSPFMVGWTAMASVITTCAWIPWILGLILHRFESNPGRDVREEARKRSPKELTAEEMAAIFAAGNIRTKRISLALSLSVAGLLLAGHLQFAAYGLLAAGLLGIWQMVSNWRDPEAGDSTTYEVVDQRTGEAHEAGWLVKAWISPGFRSGLAVIVAVGFGLLMSTTHMLPVLSYSKFSHRTNTPTEEGYQAYLGGAIKPWELVTVPAPTLLGHPGRWSTRENGLSSYWPPIEKPGANFAESAISFGPLAFLLLLCLPFRSFRWREHGGIAAIGLFGAFMALGTPLNRLFYFFAPGWSATGSPGRAEVLVVLAAAALAGVGATRLCDAPPEKKKLGLRLAVGFFALLVCFYTVTMLPDSFDPKMLGGAVYPIAGDVMATLLQAIPMTLLAFALAAGSVFLLLSKDVQKRRLSLAAAIAVPLVLFLPDLIPTSPTPIETVRGALDQRIAVINPVWNILLRPPALLPPNTPAAFGLHDVAGYDSLLHRDTVALLRDINGQDPAPPENGNMMFTKPSADPAKLAAAGVTEVWARAEVPGMGPQNLPQFGQPYSTEGGINRYRVQGPGRASTPAGPAQILEEDADSITVKATGPGLLTVRNRNMPGWEVLGKYSLSPTGLWLECELPSGEHEVKFRYVAPGWRLGKNVSFFAFVLLVLWTVWPRKAIAQ